MLARWLRSCPTLYAAWLAAPAAADVIAIDAMLRSRPAPSEASKPTRAPAAVADPKDAA